MKGFLRALRWMFALLVGVIFSVFLTVMILISTLSVTFTNPENLKSWLADTDLYDQAFDIGIDMISENAEETRTEEGNILQDLNDPNSEVHQIVFELITPEYIQTKVNIVIDAVYLWLEGKSEKPQFEITLADSPETINRIIILGFKQKVEGLPLCDGFPEVPEGYNPLSASCRPEQYDIEYVEEYLLELEGDPLYEEFVDNFTIKSDDLIEISTEQTQQAQTAYMVFKTSPILLAFVSLIIGLLYAALIPGVSRGFMSMGIVTFLVGSTFAAITFFSDTFIEMIYSPEMRVQIEKYVEVESEEVYDIATDLMTNMVNAIGEKLLQISLITAAAGLVIIIITFIATRARNKPENKIAPERI